MPGSHLQQAVISLVSGVAWGFMYFTNSPVDCKVQLGLGNPALDEQKAETCYMAGMWWWELGVGEKESKKRKTKEADSRSFRAVENIIRCLTLIFLSVK